ncbi:capsule biosynthesis GfcC family protein [Paraglaciecola arctica]|nr:capsule biosynthesis GfcC family protein [Paraglaciecola arctica]
MCLLLICSVAFNLVMASVTVTMQQQQYHYDHTPRLIEILPPLANKQNLYWPAAVLYQLDTTHLEEKRKLVLQQLASLEKDHQEDDSEIALSLQQLQATIKSWRLARRLPIKIDYDLARIVAAANPQLPEGNYLLAVAPRSKTVQLFGAVNKTSNLPHLDHADASEYLTNQHLSKLADKDTVIIIQADGREIKAPVAYWNKTHQEVMPGSQLFVPFKHSLFHPEFTSINQQIVTLALNRVTQ